MITKYNIFLDDLRIPTDVTWVNIPVDQHYSLVRSYKEFVDLITLRGVPMYVCYDHDLSDFNNTEEKTGYDCCKYLVSKSMETGIPLPQIYVHSANPIGSANMMGYINNYFMNSRHPQTCVRVNIPHTIEETLQLSPEARKAKWDRSK